MSETRAPRGPKILFATSNGTGLGHLNRAMAIARRLPERFETVIFTLSEAAPVVARSGFRVEYHPSYRRSASGSDWQWNMRLRRRLERLLAAEQPDLVVFDGVHPYRALTHVLTARGAPRSVWCRRPMWRAGSSKAPLRRTSAFDAVLEPGELAEPYDRGPTVARRQEVITVDPIVFLEQAEVIDREAAARQLGLDPKLPTALVNLGQGGSTDHAVERVLAVLGNAPQLQVAALESSIGPGLDVPRGVVRLKATFPMSRYFNAFDLAVAAAGYNAFHELIAFAVPSLFVPMPRRTDDQAARARWASEQGVGLAVSGAAASDLERELERLLDPEERARIAAAARQRFPGNGAAAAADALADLAEGGAPVARSTRRPGRLQRWLHQSSHPIGPSLPIALALTIRDHVYYPERGRPMAVVSALGVPEQSFASELQGAIDSLGLPPERVLVVTDSLDFATLRGFGVAFQRLPTALELGLDPAGSHYASLLATRFDDALSPWHGRWPMRRIGGGNELLQSGGSRISERPASRAGRG